MDLDSLVRFVGGSAIIVGAAAWVARSLISNFFSRDLERHKAHLQAQHESELAELKHKYSLELEHFRSEVQSKAATQDRIRAEVVRWANPILGSVDSLERRLLNILAREGHLALEKEFHHPNWSINYGYFMSSTLYTFASYFYWVGRLREALSFELFESQSDKDAFFASMDAVSSDLRAYPPKEYSCDGPDVQVFAMQQRAIGEAMAVGSEPLRCMSYDQFLTSYEQLPLRDRLAPLRALLDGITPDDDCRWKRLEATHKAVKSLRQFCRALLDVEGPPGSSRAPNESMHPTAATSDGG